MITSKNWTHTYYNTAELKAFISLGGEENQLSGELDYLYFVTVSDMEHKELYQSTHKSLDQAIDNINAKYGHWQLLDAAIEPEGDGCSSCAAH